MHDDRHTEVGCATASRPVFLAFSLSLMAHAAVIASLPAGGLFSPPAPPVPIQVTLVRLAAEPAASKPLPTNRIAVDTPPRRHAAQVQEVQKRSSKAVHRPMAPPITKARQVAIPPPPPSEIEPASTNAVADRFAPIQTALDDSGSRTAPPPLPMPTTPPRFEADYLRNPPPDYPAQSQRNREEGTVLLRVRVLPDGLPEEIQLHRSCGFQYLDKAAMDAVRRWKFVPAREGGEAISGRVIVPIHFSLRTGS